MRDNGWEYLGTCLLSEVLQEIHIASGLDDLGSLYRLLKHWPPLNNHLSLPFP